MLFVAFVCYLVAVAMPTALAAISSGRGITLWVLEISPNKACEHAHEILANSSINNEIALYGQLAQSLADSSESALRAGNLEAEPNKAERFVIRSGTLFQKIDGARQVQDEIARQRLALFNAITTNCLQRAPGEQPAITWPLVCLVLGGMFLVLLFFSFVIASLLKVDFRPSKEAAAAQGK